MNASGLCSSPTSNEPRWSHHKTTSGARVSHATRCGLRSSAATADLSENSCREIFFVNVSVSAVATQLNPELHWGWDGASLESVSAFSHDPAASSPNLYAYCGNDPLTHTDPTGLKDVTTGVTTCKGYIKGGWIWGWVSSHDFIGIDGKGYGRCEKKLNCFGDAEIRPDDVNIYPPSDDPSKVPSGQTYSVCTSVVLDDKDYNVKVFEDCVRKEIAAQTANPGSYSVGWRDCTDFVHSVITDCRIKARITPYPKPPRPVHPL